MSLYDTEFFEERQAPRPLQAPRWKGSRLRAVRRLSTETRFSPRAVHTCDLVALPPDKRSAVRGAGRPAPWALGSGREAAVRKAPRPSGRPDPLILRPEPRLSALPVFFPPAASLARRPFGLPACPCGTTSSPLFPAAPAAPDHLRCQTSACGRLHVHPSTSRCRPPCLPCIWPVGAGTPLAPLRSASDFSFGGPGARLREARQDARPLFAR